MGFEFDFDVKAFCDSLRATKPPYECPVKECGRIYKSLNGIHFHLYNFDHDNPNGSTNSIKKPGRKKGRWHHRANRRSPSPPDFLRPHTRESLTYAQAQKLVEVDLDGRTHRINIYEPLEVITQEEIDNKQNSEQEEKNERPIQRLGRHLDNSKIRKDVVTNAPKLPEASFRIIEDYDRPDAPPRPTSYFRFIEKSADELDEEVEYDMDEEDYAWLELINEKRSLDNVSAVSQDMFELLMDRLEKESYFQSQSTGKDPNPSIDEDAVCCICNDGECQNSNVILFCDMCNLAVHQECYGVPYIPEGQWLCRRCLQSPSRAVDCALCPNKGGAFKQTDDNRWAHVVCALWIPEVCFANTVFLEPIDSIEHIPAARWKLTCYICKQRGVGACIQCHKANCYTAFHVTCAQQAGLFMKMEPIREINASGPSFSVRKTAYCDVHTPPESDSQPQVNGNDENEDKVLSAKKAKAKSRLKMRKARKILAEKRSAIPIVSIPIIPQPRLAKIASKVTMPKKTPFIQRLVCYWTLKRQSRNGVPLLRRLQSNHQTRKEQDNDKRSNALKEQLKYWQRLRQDLEKARLLVELIRKREKLKREQMKIHQLIIEMKLKPFIILLRVTLEQLQEKDSGNIFAEPVDLKEVPDYLDYIKEPMDFKTMKKRLESHYYKTINDLEKDFCTIINNCMTYNAKDTVFYRAALKMRDQGGAIIRQARRQAEKVGYDPETGLHLQQPPKIQELPSVAVVEDGARSKRSKQLKKEIIMIRRKLAMQNNKKEEEEMKLSSIKNSDLSQDAASNSDESSSAESTSEKSARSPPIVKPPSPKISPATSPKTLSPGSRRGGRGRGRTHSTRSRSEIESSTPVVTNKVEETTHIEEKVQTPNKGTSEAQNNTQSPSGVNRRTSVLFSKKAALRKPNFITPQKRSGRPKKSQDQTGQADVSFTNSQFSEVAREPTSNIPLRKRSRTTSTGSVEGESPSKRAAAISPHPFNQDSISNLSVHQPQSDSFKVYRTDNQRGSSSDSDNNSDTSSSSTTLTSSGSSLTDHSKSKSSRSSDSGDSGNEGGSLRGNRYGATARRGKMARTKTRSSNWGPENELIPLEPLDLVWAKCRGYPWYPALIINPKMPKTGYFHNGVPIPVPPDEVLALQKNYDEPVYLVLFFDAKRTWQWLPRNKLEPLGVDSGLDKAKLFESKKPAERKAVRRAYEKAILHRCRVTGESTGLSGDSSGED